MGNGKATNAEAFVQTIRRQADWGARRILVPPELLGPEGYKRWLEQLKVSGTLPDVEAATTVNVETPLSTAFALGFTGTGVPDYASETVARVWDEMVAQLPYGYPALVQRLSRLESRLNTLRENVADAKVEMHFIERSADSVWKDGLQYGLQTSIVEALGSSEDPPDEWSIEAPYGEPHAVFEISVQADRGLRLRLEIDAEDRGILSSDEAVRVSSEAALQGLRPNGGFRLRFSGRATFGGAHRALGEHRRTLDQKMARWRSAIRAIKFTMAVLDNVVSLYEIAGHVPKWSALRHGSQPEVGVANTAHDRTMQVGRALIRAQKDETPPEFNGQNEVFFKWAGDIVGVSASTIRKNLGETRCLNGEGTRGATGKGLEERIENVIQYTIRHDKENGVRHEGRSSNSKN